MPRRKQVIQHADIPSVSQDTDENTQEFDAVDGDGGSQDHPSSLLLLPPSVQHKGRRERENRTKPKEMTEEEMMKLAVRLSEQEASDTALRLQQEEEAVMKAIQESMVKQTSSQSLLTEGDMTSNLCSPRKLLRCKKRGASCTPQKDLNPAADENNLRKGTEGSPSLERTLICRSEVEDSPVQVEDPPLCKSPTFPASGCRVAVQVPRLSQNLLETCRTSGFVLFSQNSCSSSQVTVQSKSPTFPRSPGKALLCPKSPTFSETEPGTNGETQLSPDCLKSPMFGGNMQCGTSVISETTSQFVFSSQENVTSPLRNTSCSLSPNSPMLTGSPTPPKKRTTAEMNQHNAKMLDQNEQRQETDSDGQTVSDTKGRTNAMEEMSQCLKQHSSTDPDGDVWSKMAAAPTPSDHVQEVTESINASEMELTSDMMLMWSDEDDDVTPTGRRSPVFLEERPTGQADVKALNHVTAESPVSTQVTAGSDCSSNCKQQPISRERAGSVGQTVHYYWGIPFCPRGVDPDTYTQVIITQMDVYAQSLKQSQRSLLRKAAWGPPILPQPEKCLSPKSPAEILHDSPERSITQRLKHRQQSNDQRVDEEDNKDEEEGGAGEEGRVDSDNCEVCPETQLSNNDDDSDSTQDLMMVTEATAELRPGSPDPPEVGMILREDSQEEEEKMEVNDNGCSVKKTSTDPLSETTEGNITISNTDDVMKERAGPEVGEIKSRGPQRSASAEKEPAAVFPQSRDTVDCPLCQGQFPVSKIELHAAYCDGDVALVDKREPNVEVSLKPRGKRPRRGNVTKTEETNDVSNSSRNLERCYICQNWIPLRDYSRHTELCIQRQNSNTKTRGNLLSALEQVENRCLETGPSGSRLEPREVIDLRSDDDDDDDDEEERGMAVVRISNSSVRTFTPISEAADCLVDFRQRQQPKKPSQRRR